MFSPISPAEIAAILLAELLFGTGYNFLVDWGQRKHLWHVSISVIVGVAITLIIPASFWMTKLLPFWETTLLLGFCFAASGLPMTVGSMGRTVKTHKRRPWPTAALRARDDAIMQLSSLAHEISVEAKFGRLTAGHLPDYVNRLHETIGTLKSV